MHFVGASWHATQNKKFSVKDFVSKCEEIPQNCPFLHIYVINPQRKIELFVGTL